MLVLKEKPNIRIWFYFITENPIVMTGFSLHSLMFILGNPVVDFRVHQAIVVKLKPFLSYL